jgi:membrane protein implicated in regulation of membrane protease activity
VLILAILAGAATGIVLGLFGSGGSIIAMPALMLLLNVEAKSAIAMSLGIVAVTATITRKPPKPRLSVSCEKRWAMRVPAKLPAMVTAVNEPMMLQSMATAPR